MINNVVLVGRLTRDPELRHTPSNVAVATFSLTEFAILRIRQVIVKPILSVASCGVSKLKTLQIGLKRVLL